MVRQGLVADESLDFAPPGGPQHAGQGDVRSGLRRASNHRRDLPVSNSSTKALSSRRLAIGYVDLFRPSSDVCLPNGDGYRGKRLFGLSREHSPIGSRRHYCRTSQNRKGMEAAGRRETMHLCRSRSTTPILELSILLRTSRARTHIRQEGSRTSGRRFPPTNRFRSKPDCRRC